MTRIYMYQENDKQTGMASRIKRRATLESTPQDRGYTRTYAHTTRDYSYSYSRYCSCVYVPGMYGVYVLIRTGYEYLHAGTPLVHILQSIYLHTFSRIKIDWRKARERELATFDENRRAVEMLNPMHDKN